MPISDAQVDSLAKTLASRSDEPRYTDDWVEYKPQARRILEGQEGMPTTPGLYYEVGLATSLRAKPETAAEVERRRVEASRTRLLPVAAEDVKSSYTRWYEERDFTEKQRLYRDYQAAIKRQAALKGRTVSPDVVESQMGAARAEVERRGEIVKSEVLGVGPRKSLIEREAMALAGSRIRGKRHSAEEKWRLISESERESYRGEALARLERSPRGEYTISDDMALALGVMPEWKKRRAEELSSPKVMTKRMAMHMKRENIRVQKSKLDKVIARLESQRRAEISAGGVPSIRAETVERLLEWRKADVGESIMSVEELSRHERDLGDVIKQAESFADIEEAEVLEPEGLYVPSEEEKRRVVYFEDPHTLETAAIPLYLLPSHLREKYRGRVGETVIVPRGYNIVLGEEGKTVLVGSPLETVDVERVRRGDRLADLGEDILSADIWREYAAKAYLEGGRFAYETIKPVDVPFVPEIHKGLGAAGPLYSAFTGPGLTEIGRGLLKGPPYIMSMIWSIPPIVKDVLPLPERDPEYLGLPKMGEYFRDIREGGAAMLSTLKDVGISEASYEASLPLEQRVGRWILGVEGVEPSPTQEALGVAVAPFVSSMMRKARVKPREFGATRIGELLTISALPTLPNLPWEVRTVVKRPIPAEYMTSAELLARPGGLPVSMRGTMPTKLIAEVKAGRPWTYPFPEAVRRAGYEYTLPKKLMGRLEVSGIPKRVTPEMRRSPWETGYTFEQPTIVTPSGEVGIRMATTYYDPLTSEAYISMRLPHIETAGKWLAEARGEPYRFKHFLEIHEIHGVIHERVHLADMGLSEAQVQAGTKLMGRALGKQKAFEKGELLRTPGIGAPSKWLSAYHTTDQPLASGVVGLGERFTPGLHASIHGFSPHFLRVSYGKPRLFGWPYEPRPTIAVTYFEKMGRIPKDVRVSGEREARRWLISDAERGVGYITPKVERLWPYTEPEAEIVFAPSSMFQRVGVRFKSKVFGRQARVEEWFVSGEVAPKTVLGKAGMRLRGKRTGEQMQRIMEESHVEYDYMAGYRPPILSPYMIGGLGAGVSRRPPARRPMGRSAYIPSVSRVSRGPAYRGADFYDLIGYVPKRAPTRRAPSYGVARPSGYPSLAYEVPGYKPPKYGAPYGGPSYGAPYYGVPYGGPSYGAPYYGVPYTPPPPPPPPPPVGKVEDIDRGRGEALKDFDDYFSRWLNPSKAPREVLGSMFGGRRKKSRGGVLDGSDLFMG